MFYALADQGYNDLLLETLINPDYPGWGYMVHQGATTVWERWEKEMGSEMHSFNHPMFGSYDGWLYNKIAGINIPDDAQGADKLVIQPLLTEKLNRVSASIETLRGTVRCSYQKTDGRVSYEITVPTNTTAKIILQGKVISVNGKPVKSGDLTVNSGVYKIETENL